MSDYERERQKASDGVWLNAGGESWASQEDRDGEAASGMDEAGLATQDPQSQGSSSGRCSCLVAQYPLMILVTGAVQQPLKPLEAEAAQTPQIEAVKDQDRVLGHSEYRMHWSKRQSLKIG